MSKKMIKEYDSKLSTKALQYLNAMILPTTATGLTALYATLKKLLPSAAFANGGVVTKPTIGLVGEYASAGTGNPEIITPTNLMKEVVENANSNLASVYINVGR